MKLFPWLAVAVPACPLFVEIFPDPVDVPDREGEFVEVRLDESFAADSVAFWLDGKAVVAVPYPEGSRLVLVHDSAYCPSRAGIACALFKETLPNSRESGWRLLAGSCTDSVVLAAPKAGRSFQRRGESDDWVFADPTPGYADAGYEYGIRDCAVGLSGVTLVDSLPGGNGTVSGENAWRTFRVKGWVDGCDTALLRVESFDLSAGNRRLDSVAGPGNFSLDFDTRGSLWLRLVLPEDDAPRNNVVDTLLLVEGRAPLVVSEVHHCPPEGVPEWAEVYNAARHALPLSRTRFCGKGGFWGAIGDSIMPQEAVLLTRDSAELRSHLGFADARIVQVAMGYLNNMQGSLELCFDSTVVDRVSWDKGTVSCPEGFSPLTQSRDNTPGFVSKTGTKAESPFELKLSGRVIRMRGVPLRVRVESAGEVALRLLDSSGREVWKEMLPANSSLWREVPVQSLGRVGVNYVAARLGDYEKVVGIVLRP